MNKQKLKDLLLTTYQVCIDNEYLNQYLDLVETNCVSYSEMSVELFKQENANYHHVIPLSAYYKFLSPDVPQRKRAHKARKIADCDPNCFMILLSVSDHLLAHYYLMQCAVNSTEIKNNISALTFIIADQTQEQLQMLLTDNKISQISFLTIKIKTQLQKLSVDTKIAIDPQVYVHKDNSELTIPQIELSYYNNLGWQLGRVKSSNSKFQPRCYIHREGVYKNILLSKLPDYLEEGWEYGAAGKPRKKQK